MPLGAFVLIIVSSTLAFGKRLPWDLLPWNLGYALWTAIALLIVAALILEPFKKRADALAQTVLQKRFWFFGLIVLTAGYQALNYVLFRGLGYGIPWPQFLICLASLILIRPGNLGYSMIFNLAIMGASILIFPLTVERSDMLLVIQRAFDLLHQGISPYSFFELNGINRMPYLPFTFFSHWPAWQLSIDPRWIQFFYRALWMGLLFSKIRSASKSSPWLLATQTILLHPYLLFRHDLYFDFFLLLIVLYGCFAWARSFLLPVLVLTRQWIWVVVPFLFWNSLRSHGLRRTLVQTFTGTVAAIVLCFSLLHSTTSLGMLRDAVFGFQNTIAQSSLARDYGPTFAHLAFYLGRQSWLLYFQGVIAVALFLWTVFKRPQQWMQYTFATWALFLMLNGHYWNYFWISPLVFAVSVVQTHTSDRISFPEGFYTKRGSPI